MAITRYDINGDLTALKAALDATGFFDSTAYDSDETETPTKVLCYDASNNLLFEASATGCKAYKSGGGYAGTSGSSNYGSPTYLYRVGTKAALIQHANAKGNSSACTVIGMTNTGVLGFAFPRTLGATSATADVAQMGVAAWDDPSDMTSLLAISSTSMAGNSAQLVPIPMHGVYGTPEYMETAFYLPMAQTNMRSIMQEFVAADGKTYLTNGWIAVYDDIGLLDD